MRGERQQRPYRYPRRSGRALLEARAPFEFAYLVASAPALGRAPRGAGDPVLVLPGLAASDLSTRPLRTYLRRQGHRVHGWRLGRNVGPTPRVVRGVADRLVQVYERSGGLPVSIVGWSLGGVFAAALADTAPGMVKRVVTLGSPLAVLDDPAIAQPQLYAEIADVTGPAPGPMPPLTSIWSRTDGIVPWPSSSMAGRRLRGISEGEDIEVHASHIGIGMNPIALYAVADRLALPGQTLPPFRPPFAATLLYPRPAQPASA